MVLIFKIRIFWGNKIRTVLIFLVLVGLGSICGPPFRFVGSIQVGSIRGHPPQATRPYVALRYRTLPYPEVLVILPTPGYGKPPVTTLPIET